jgi:hypothetical protein
VMQNTPKLSDLSLIKPLGKLPSLCSTGFAPFAFSWPMGPSTLAGHRAPQADRKRTARYPMQTGPYRSAIIDLRRGYQRKTPCGYCKRHDGSMYLHFACFVQEVVSGAQTRSPIRTLLLKQSQIQTQSKARLLQAHHTTYPAMN